jgi:hypothetical protein
MVHDDTMQGWSCRQLVSHATILLVLPPPFGLVTIWLAMPLSGQPRLYQVNHATIWLVMSPPDWLLNHPVRRATIWQTMQPPRKLRRRLVSHAIIGLAMQPFG